MSDGHQFFEQFTQDSPDFAWYSKIFEYKLERLYRVQYEHWISQRLDDGEWHIEPYYHFTGNCGCLAEKVVSANEDYYMEVSTRFWCRRAGCPIQGILNNGLMTTYSRFGRPTLSFVPR